MSIIATIYDKGRRFWLNGLPEYRQRFDAILAVGHYLWYGDPVTGRKGLPGDQHDETRQELITQWLERNGVKVRAGGQTEAYIRRACTWRNRFKTTTPYAPTDRLVDRMIETGLPPAVMEAANQKKAGEARCRIAKAVERLMSMGLPLTINLVARAARANRRTVRKHFDLIEHGPTNSLGHEHRNQKAKIQDPQGLPLWVVVWVLPGRTLGQTCTKKRKKRTRFKDMSKACTFSRKARGRGPPKSMSTF